MIPKHIKTKVEASVKRLSSHPIVQVPFINVWDGFQPKDCHNNVGALVMAEGGKQITGWWLNVATDFAYVSCSWHSVWEVPGGELVDITPWQDHRGKRLFLPSEGNGYDGSDFAFRLTKNKKAAKAKARALWHERKWLNKDH